MKALLLLLLAPMSLIGQSLDTSVGASQTLGMAGVQTSYQFKGRFGWTGIGYDNGLHIAAYTNIPLRMFILEDTTPDRYRVGLGDQVLDSGLATDEFDFSKAMVRGASLLRHTEDGDLQVFVGNFSAQDMQPYLYTTNQVNSDVVGAVVGHTRLSKTLNLQSFNTFGDGNTSIQSLAWTPSRHWHLSTADGMGTNHLYLANAAEFRRNGGLTLRASYTLADNNFHRQGGTYGVEPLGFNGKAEIPIGQHILARFNHIHQLTLVPKSLGFQQSSSIGTEDLAGITTSFFGFRAYASASRSSSNRNRGKDFAGVASLSRSILPRWRSTFSYLHNAMALQSVEVYQDTNEVRINSHLALSHNFDRINGSITNTFGGRWSSNLLSFSIDNQVYSSPVAAQLGQKSVFQAWNFSIRFRTSHGTTTHLETTIDPFGKTQWGGYLSGLQYRGLNTYSQDAEHVTFSKYVINGRVIDENGKGVWGIALKIGGDTVMSDTEGSFFVHVKGPKPVAFTVAADASLQSLRWNLASAPTSAQGSLENTPTSIRVVVQMGNHNREIASAGGN